MCDFHALLLFVVLRFIVTSTFSREDLIFTTRECLHAMVGTKFVPIVW